MSIRFTRRAWPALVLAAVLAVSLPAAVEAASVTIHLREALSAKTLTVAPGTTVRWANESDERHRMRSRTGPVEFDSGNIEPGESYAFTFTVPGSYPYLDDRDRDDPGFHGTIVVASGGSSGGSGGSGTGGSGGSAANPPGGGGGAAPAAATVHMANREFGPSSVTIAAGGSVTFLNDDDREHTASGDAFDTGVLKSGARSTQKFASAGTFSFLCQIHPDMRGTVNVRGGSGAVPPPAATPKPTPKPTLVPPIVPEPGTKAASIVDFAFEPDALEVQAGTTVTWQNRGDAPHTVTASDGSFDSGMIAAGATYARTFDSPGTFAFACTFHPDMTGTVIVSAGAASPTTAATSSASPEPSGTPPALPLDVAFDNGVPPAAAEPDDTSPASEIREGALRLLLVGVLVAGGLLVFGFIVAGTTRRGGESRIR
ncbi:MAG TPA: cupredoxin domain-containing protein [Candidatus Limnocylindrales bacterium]|nr:cupredoxin domain-containing protein [Candidatus Limnocylindrales bacterium]